MTIPARLLSLLAMLLSLLAMLVLLPRISAAADSSETPPSPITLKAAVEFALGHHPLLKARSAQEQVAKAGVDLARTQLIPRGDIGLQENRATGNVVPGPQFSMPGIPSVAGPPTDRVFDSGVWGSTAGLSIWWDVARLKQQMDLVDAALADRRGAQAAYAAAQLTIAFAAADAFTAAVEAQDQVAVARETVKRARVFQGTVDALVRGGLRPGADAARAAAEVAQAQTELIHAEEAVDLSHAKLAEALGIAGHDIALAPGRLVDPPPSAAERQNISPRNPFVVSADQAVRAADDRNRAAMLEYIPRAEIAAAVWGRGSGLFPGGAKLGFGQGLAPDTPNWASGVVVTIPILQYPEIHARTQLAAANARVAAANRDVVVQQVETQIDSAAAVVKSAYRAADQARISLQSSRSALSQAQARYKGGLYAIDAVADALRLVAQAEAVDAVARTDIWRARMLLGRAVGDLDPMLAEIGEASGGQ